MLYFRWCVSDYSLWLSQRFPTLPGKKYLIILASIDVSLCASA